MAAQPAELAPLPKLLYMKSEAAAILHSSIPMIERLIARRLLRSIKVRCYRCIPARELEVFVATQTA